ncbi:hypothetical protein GE061_004613 [Apolygus lucorum]|uniref:Histone-lysine N-methyltransferase eggless n=1 Tax=Apolygus lucorum TaxID=248454 RepID=A0A8S9X3N9_APOLU|nr:hypothetical protein GE061_004613 [Apolygus lucorum]
MVDHRFKGIATSFEDEAQKKSTNPIPKKPETETGAEAISSSLRDEQSKNDVNSTPTAQNCGSAAATLTKTVVGNIAASINSVVVNNDVPNPKEPEIIEIDITDKDSPGDVEQAVVDTLNFQEMLDIISKATEQPCVSSRNKKGPVCCNSWCDSPASIIPEEYIRDYYNIPPGKSFKLCNGCVESYYSYVEKAVKNLETNGNMLEGRCARNNEFIILDNESDEEEDASDPEMEKLLGDAIKESLKELDQQLNFNGIFNRAKEQVIEQLEKFAIDGTDLAHKVSNIETDLYKSTEEFKRKFKKEKTAVMAELDMPLGTGMDHNLKRGRNIGDRNGATESSGLPQFGDVTRPPPRVGDSVYAMKEYNFSEWIPFTVTDVIYDADEHGNFVETFSLQTVVNNVVLKRVVNGDHVAYSNIPTVQLGIGTRIIGAYNQNLGVKQSAIYLSGMVAELPTNINQYRYLVFFDNGKAQYCIHEDLKVVYKATKKIHEYFIGFHSNFVQQYLNNFPERPMVKTNTEHFVRVELNGFWISGKVDMLDGSLARVTFLNDNHSEWIYRGSPRLRPVYERLQANLRSGNSTSVPAMQQKTRRPAPAKQLNPGMQIVIDSSDDEEDSNSSNNVRAVAKKSTSRTVQNLPVTQHQKRVTRSCVIRRLPSMMLNPNTFHHHKCSRACVTWVKYSEDKTQGANPLAIPAIFAFRREIDVTSAVTYTAPCGKRLKNIQEVLKYLSETLIPLTLDMFDFDIRTQIFDEYVVASQFTIMEDISFGAERNPVACVNEVDTDCPDLMQYMTERRPLEGVNMNLDPDFLVCCDCEDNCRDRSKCRCWRLTIDNFKPFNQGDNKRHITKIGYQYQRLDQNLLSGIYECNSRCHCNTVTCINRVVQHRTRHKLQLFKTSKKGWGTRCLNDIPQGVFISTYVGNILTEPSANETGTINGDEYFAELDHIEVMEEHKADFEAQALKMSDEEDEESEEETTLPLMSSSGRALRSSTHGKRKRNSGGNTPSKPGSRKAPSVQEAPVLVNNSDDEDDDGDSVRKYYGPNETVYVMDAKIAGNIGRYFNHSCNPNIFVQNVYVDTHDLRFPWVAFFALRHIPAGSELTWDYGYKIGSVPGKVLYCYCGSHNCRKRLL